MKTTSFQQLSTMRRFMIVSIITSIILSGVTALIRYVYANERPKTVKYGVTFSTKYATYLGQNWKQMYIDTLDELGVRRYRIPVYWDEIEQEHGIIELSHIQWMLDEAHKRNATVFLVVGMRVPRWPECHIPSWAKNVPEQELQQAEQRMVTSVVNAFKTHPALDKWQVENEAFFSAYGDCPVLTTEYISGLINHVRTLDPHHQIIVTESGELSMWLRAAAEADILGISIYRRVWNPVLGYFRYPIPPSIYRKKAELNRRLVNDIIVTELQAEPWTRHEIVTTPLEEQYRTMSIDHFIENITFARRAEFSEVYFWGVEWWYWMKQEKHNNQYWETAKALFLSSVQK